MKTLIVAGLLGFAVIVLEASAQALSPASAPATLAQPDVTTAAYGDWVLQCQRSDPQVPWPSCELLHAVRAEGPQPVARLAIARIAPQAPLKLAVVLPMHVSFAEVPRLLPGAEAVPAVDLVWRRCLPVGCFADGDLSDAAARQWRLKAPAGRLVFQDGSGRPVALPVSFRGLGEALDALSRQ